jgi:hypothetical protein
LLVLFLNFSKSLFRFLAERPSLSWRRFILNFLGLSTQISSTFREYDSLLINLIRPYLKALSVPQAIWRITGCLTNDEFERKWKEAMMANIRILSRNSPGGTEENPILRVTTVVSTRFEAVTSRTQLTPRANLLSVKMLES